MIPIVLQKIGITDEDLVYEFLGALEKLNTIGLNVTLTDLAMMYLSAQPKMRDIESKMDQWVFREPKPKE